MTQNIERMWREVKKMFRSMEKRRDIPIILKGFNSFLYSNHVKSVIMHFGNNLQNKNLINDTENN